MRRSRNVAAARSTAAAAAFSHDSVLLPTSSITLYTLSAMALPFPLPACAHALHCGEWISSSPTSFYRGFALEQGHMVAKRKPSLSSPGGRCQLSSRLCLLKTSSARRFMRLHGPSTLRLSPLRTIPAPNGQEMILLEDHDVVRAVIRRHPRPGWSSCLAAHTDSICCRTTDSSVRI